MRIYIHIHRPADLKNLYSGFFSIELQGRYLGHAEAATIRKINAYRHMEWCALSTHDCIFKHARVIQGAQLSDRLIIYRKSGVPINARKEFDAITT